MMMNRILNLPYCFCSSCPNPTEDVLVLQVTADCADDAECRPSSGDPCTNHTAVNVMYCPWNNRWREYFGVPQTKHLLTAMRGRIGITISM